MASIAFVAPDFRLLEKAREVLRPQHPEVRIEEGLLGKGAEVAERLVSEGTEVIISRGGTAKAIQNALPDLAVVAVFISALDLLEAVSKAAEYGRRIGVVSFPFMTVGVDLIGRTLGLDVAVYGLGSETEAETLVLRAREEGADVVVGGIITGIMAQKHGIPCQVIDSGTDSIVAAVLEAKRIGHAMDVEKAKSSLLRAVLTYACDGIIAVDREARVTVFNPIAAQMVRIAEADALDRPISDIWPGLELDSVVRKGRDDLGQIVRGFDQDVVCNKIAITVQGVVVGAVATLHDVSQIQTMEATVRRRSHATGHVATTHFQDVLGSGGSLRKAISMGMDYARTNSTVLILGETGTGKELFAQSIHNHSSRSRGPFVAVNCAALPGQLLESELFGYIAGAFTGASQKGKPGLFELAHGGTIFLDEIAEMDSLIQGKLLRVIQEKKVMRLGSDQVIPVDVRVIAATNKSLKALVDSGAFRDDLYYRLNVLQLRLPPLRERLEDIPMLAGHFLRQSTRPKFHPRLTPAAVSVLDRYSWPGNVRELQNVMERVLATAKEEVISEVLIRQLLEDSRHPPAGARLRPDPAQEIRNALTRSNGKYAEAARILGISRSTLWRRIRQLGLS